MTKEILTIRIHSKYKSDGCSTTTGKSVMPFELLLHRLTISCSTSLQSCMFNIIIGCSMSPTRKDDDAQNLITLNADST